jgi:TolB-like protein
MIYVRILSALLSAIVCFSARGQNQDMDTELSSVATKLANLTKENGKKKVTVLDFTDLQGVASELGKYIAEELTVNLVMVKKDFSVLDRANLRRILAEHKLTATGLVDPENAKKLGQFAGVDALILGTITPKGKKVNLTAKIITTDTAEIVGAAKAEFLSDETVQKLLSQSAQTEDVGTQVEARSPAPTAPAKPFGDLQAKVESLQFLPADAAHAYAKLTFIITNASATTTYGVGVHPDIYQHFNLSNSRGDDFQATEISGIEKAVTSAYGFGGALTDIPPKSAITITSKSQVLWTGKPGDYRPYRLQTEVVFGEEVNGRPSNLRKHNLILDIK